MKAENKNTLIDLKKVLKERNPKLNKLIPGFIKNWLIKTIHQEDLNIILRNYGHNTGLDFIESVFKHLNVTVTSEGLDKFDFSKKYVFASNHPLGGLDGLAIIYEVGKKSENVKAVINDLLLYIYSLREVFHGVNVYGKNTKDHIKKLDELYKSDSQVIVFPAGLVSRKINGRVSDPKWKKSFLTKAMQHKRDVIPVFINGKNSKFFYNFARIRKFIGIKFNIELIYLPAEVFKYRNKSIHIKFGEVLSIDKLNSTKSIDKWVEVIREKTYELS